MSHRKFTIFSPCPQTTFFHPKFHLVWWHHYLPILSHELSSSQIVIPGPTLCDAEMTRGVMLGSFRLFLFSI